MQAISDVSLTDAAHRLGKLKATFTFSWGSLLMHLLLVVVLGGIFGAFVHIRGPALAAALNLSGFLEFALDAAGLVALLAYGSYVFVRYHRSRGLCLQIFEEGFACARDGRVTTCRWEDVATVREDFGGAGNLCRWIRIGSRRGEEWHFDMNTDLLDQFHEMAEQIQQEVGRAHLPGAVAEIEAGRAVDFGALRVSRAGMECGGEMLPWHLVGKGTINEFALTIGKAGAWRAWRRLAIGALVNRRLLTELWKHVERERKASQANP